MNVLDISWKRKNIHTSQFVSSSFKADISVSLLHKIKGSGSLAQFLPSNHSTRGPRSTWGRLVAAATNRDARAHQGRRGHFRRRSSLCWKCSQTETSRK